MATWLRTYRWKLALGLLLLGAFLAAGMLTRQNPSVAAGTEMPEAYQAYWTWISSINQGASDAPVEGARLLNKYPDLPFLYVRFAEVCLAKAAEDLCRNVLQGMKPQSPEVELYHQTALTLLLTPRADAPDDSTARWQQIGRWQYLARNPALDPALARFIVDHASRNRQEEWLPPVEAVWREQLAADSLAIGAAFGLGYAAVLRQDWEVAEPLLQRVVATAPDDPQAYRELGRIYYLTSQPERFEETLQRGIEAAEAQHDLEQQLILSGNLGWGLAQRTGNLQKAEQRIRAALAQSRALSDGETEGFNLYRLATISLQQSKYEEVLALLDTAAVRYQKHAVRQYPSVLALRGATLSSMYRFSDAERTLEAAITEAEEHRNVLVRIQALVGLTQLRYRMGRYAAAREAGLEALALAEKYRTGDFEIAARLALGDVERRWGNLETAQAHFEAGLQRAEQAKNSARVRELYNRLGRTALSTRDANSAQVYFESLLEAVRQGDEVAGLSQAYLGLGNTYHQFQNTDEALHYYDLALDALPPGEALPLHGEILIAKGWSLLQDGRFEEAAEHFEAAASLHSDDLSNQYRAEVGLGTVHLNQKQYRSALTHFTRAERIEQQVERPMTRWHVLFAKALAYWRTGQTRQAEAAFTEAIAVIEALRENLGQSANRSYFIQDKVQVYEHFAVFLEEQGRSEDALMYTERARSRGLVDLLYTTQREGDIQEGLPTDQIIEMDRRIRALTQALADAALDEPLLADAADPGTDPVTRASRLRDEYRRADSLYRQVQMDLIPRQQIYTFNPLSPDSVRSTLLDGEAMIVYDLRRIGPAGDVVDASVAYVVLPDTVMPRPLDLDTQALTETIRFFRDHIGHPDGEPGRGWDSAARRLYLDLMAPVVETLPASVKHLHLVPEGVLHYLPFAALQDEQGRFLVERYTLSTVPSASILNLSRAQNPQRWRSMLLFADPEGRLPGSRTEVLDIKARSPNRRQALVGQRATKANVKEFASQYDILHFATHGRFASRTPWRSALELHGGEMLSVEEIGRLNLSDAYLVTLSACETGLSGGLVADVPSGDEFIGLNQAFLAAGTPTVMSSLWPIDDRVSSEFMIDFYEHLGPQGKATALANVQRRFIQSNELRHPFYWAAFTIIGDPL